MGFVMIRIEVPSQSDSELNKVVEPTNSHEGVQQLINLLEGIEGGAVNAEVDVAVRNTTQTISAAGAGSSANYNLK